MNKSNRTSSVLVLGFGIAVCAFLLNGNTIAYDMFATPGSRISENALKLTTAATTDETHQHESSRINAPDNIALQSLLSERVGQLNEKINLMSTRQEELINLLKETKEVVLALNLPRHPMTNSNTRLPSEENLRAFNSAQGLLSGFYATGSKFDSSSEQRWDEARANMSEDQAQRLSDDFISRVNKGEISQQMFKNSPFSH